MAVREDEGPVVLVRAHVRRQQQEPRAGAREAPERRDVVGGGQVVGHVPVEHEVEGRAVGRRGQRVGDGVEHREGARRRVFPCSRHGRGAHVDAEVLHREVHAGDPARVAAGDVEDRARAVAVDDGAEPGPRAGRRRRRRPAAAVAVRVRGAAPGPVAQVVDAVEVGRARLRGRRRARAGRGPRVRGRDVRPGQREAHVHGRLRASGVARDEDVDGDGGRAAPCAGDVRDDVEPVAPGQQVAEPRARARAPEDVAVARRLAVEVAERRAGVAGRRAVRAAAQLEADMRGVEVEGRAAAGHREFERDRRVPAHGRRRRHDDGVRRGRGDAQAGRRRRGDGGHLLHGEPVAADAAEQREPEQLEPWGSHLHRLAAPR